MKERSIPLGNLRAIAFSRGDTLYGATTTGRLYRIHLATGDTSFVGASPGLRFLGLACNPISGALWASVRTPIDSIFTLNTATGAATFVGVTGFNAITTSIAFDRLGTLYALIDNGSGEDYLAALDGGNASGTILAGPLDLHFLRAIAMRSDPVSSVPGGQSELPTSMVLHQNYPNPFNPSTVIRYSIPASMDVRLAVFDLLGREVALLVNERKSAGWHEARFDGSGLSSGVYFYRLSSGRFVETKKLLLLR